MVSQTALCEEKKKTVTHSIVADWITEKPQYYI